MQKLQGELNLHVLATRRDLNFIPLVAPPGFPRGEFSSVSATRCPYVCAGKSALSWWKHSLKEEKLSGRSRKGDSKLPSWFCVLFDNCLAYYWREKMNGSMIMQLYFRTNFKKEKWIIMCSWILYSHFDIR